MWRIRDPAQGAPSALYFTTVINAWRPKCGKKRVQWCSSVVAAQVDRRTWPGKDCYCCPPENIQAGKWEEAIRRLISATQWCKPMCIEIELQLVINDLVDFWPCSHIKWKEISGRDCFIGKTAPTCHASPLDIDATQLVRPASESVCDNTQNLNGTKSESFFRYQIFPIPNPILFSIPNIFRYRIRYLFQ